MTNNRMTTGIVLEEGLKEKLTGGRVRIVFSHVNFPADDVSFGLEILLRKAGEEDEFKENTNKGIPGGTGTIDVVNGSVKGGVGIPLPSVGIHAGSKFRPGERIRALEYHVFKHV